MNQAEDWYQGLAEKPQFTRNQKFCVKAAGQNAFTRPPATNAQTTHRGPIALVDSCRSVLHLHNAPNDFTWDNPGNLNAYDIGVYNVDSALTRSKGVMPEQLHNAGDDPLTIAFSKHGAF